MERPILFYDGDCGFCNRVVAYVLRNDRTKEIQFSSLQSDHAKTFFELHGLPAPDLSTFYFYDGIRIFQKSTASLKVTKWFKFPAWLLSVGWIVPKFVRDFGYDLIAKRRQRLAKGYCFVPTGEDRKRFI